MVLMALLPAAGGKAGCGGGFVADVGVGSDDLEEIESDVFRAASGIEGSVHGDCLSKSG